MKLRMVDGPVQEYIIGWKECIFPSEFFYYKYPIIFPEWSPKQVTIGMVSYDGNILVSPLLIRLFSKKPYFYSLWNTVVHELLHRMLHKRCFSFHQLIHLINKKTKGWIL